jgi:hypothetical protein
MTWHYPLHFCFRASGGMAGIGDTLNMFRDEEALEIILRLCNIKSGEIQKFDVKEKRSIRTN